MEKTRTHKGFIFWPILLLVLLASTFFVFNFFNGRCNKIREFSIGLVDPKFKTSSEEVQKIATDAANRWNEQAGKNLLKYNPSAALKINLIYDQRQADIDQLNSESQNLQQNRQKIESTKEKFDELLSTYESDLKEYNSEVAYWNANGGATSGIYNRLESTRTSLNQRRDQLISMSKTLNLQSGDFNSDLNNLQSEIDKRKNLIITQGLYVPSKNEIDIYTFGNTEELRLVLMHELGHAIGLEHDNVPNSIMYYLLGDQDLANPTLTDEDKQMVSGRCLLSNGNLFRTILQTSETQ